MSARTELDNYSPSPKWMRYLLGYFALFMVCVLTKVKVKGRNNIPESGPYVVAANHFSYIDPPFVVYALQRPITFLAASDQAIKWYFKWAAWLYGFIPTNRTRLAPSTIKAAKRVLKTNNILGIFPEGTSTERTLREAKRGIVYLSTLNNTPILPVSIHGLMNVWPNWFKGVRPNVIIQIGKPFLPKGGVKGALDREIQIKTISENIISRIATLLPKETHAIVKSNKRIELYAEENNI